MERKEKTDERRVEHKFQLERKNLRVALVSQADTQSANMQIEPSAGALSMAAGCWC